MQDFFRVIQVSDTHLYADAGQCLLGINTQASFTAVIETIAEQPWLADLLLLTGDLSQDEHSAAYHRLATAVNQLKIPTYWLAGNHDEVAAMQKNLTGPLLHQDKFIVKENWLIILLNSQVHGKPHGLLAPSELQFLKTCLLRYPLQHVLICLHHPPISIGSQWLDISRLKNAAEFLAIVDQHPQIKAILSGHIHQEFSGQHKTVQIYSAPATSIQFKPESQQFALDIIPPGFRCLELYRDGRIETNVIRTDKFADYVKADPLAKGY